MSRIWMFLGSQCSMTRRRCSPSEDWPELCEQESKHKNAIWGLRGRRHWPDDGARCSCWWAWSERTIRFLATAQRRGCSSGPLALLHFVAASGRGERVVVAVDDDDGPTTAANFASACLFRIFMFSAITYLKTQAKLTHSLLREGCENSETSLEALWFPLVITAQPRSVPLLSKATLPEAGLQQCLGNARELFNTRNTVPFQKKCDAKFSVRQHYLFISVSCPYGPICLYRPLLQTTQIWTQIAYCNKVSSFLPTSVLPVSFRGYSCRWNQFSRIFGK